MALQPFQNEQLNYFKFAFIVLNEFPKALRKTFTTMWDNNFGHLPGFQPWDDSIAVRNMFLRSEGGKTRVPTNLSYKEWNCTTLFQATIYARSFAWPDSKGHYRTLSDLYLRHRNVTHGRFHASVVSPAGNKAETFALAIDQLRLLRNLLSRATRPEIDKETFDQYVQHAKDAFKALEVESNPIHVIGGLTESHFPTEEVRKLEQAIQEETRKFVTLLGDVLTAANNRRLEDISSAIHELKMVLTKKQEKMEKSALASKEDTYDLDLALKEIKGLKSAPGKDTSEDTKPSLQKSYCPPKVPCFTGRKAECDEITDDVASGCARIVSIWGPPGMGKTSVAVSVGNHLLSQGFPVYFLSLLRLQSITDLAFNILSLFTRPLVCDEQQQQKCLSIDDELSHLVGEISERTVLILDHADNVLSGGPKMNEDFTHFLENILISTQKLAFVVTAREPLEFAKEEFQDHMEVRICQLNESSSQTLAQKLVPNATVSDCARIAQICGNIPLATKLLCSIISEGYVQPSQSLDDFLKSLEMNNTVLEMLSNPEYPSNRRLKLIFNYSSERFSPKEKEDLVSLSVLTESFDLKDAAAVLEIRESQTHRVARILESLQRKSLLDSSSKSGSFQIHPQLLSFANQLGRSEMKESVLNSESRLCAYHISRFEDLNEKFLTGNSMSAFIEFYEDEKGFLQSIVKGCLDSKTSNIAFGALVKAELFLQSLFWNKEENIDTIYNSAIEAAKLNGKNLIYRQLLASFAFTKLRLGAKGRAMQLLSEASEADKSCFSVPVVDKGKLLCYSGIYQLVTGNAEVGVKHLEEALHSMDGTPEQRILRIIAYQILAIYYRFKGESSQMSLLHNKTVKECREMGDLELLIISQSKGKEIAKKSMNQRDPEESNNQPLVMEVISIVKEATNHLCDEVIKKLLRNAALNIAKRIQKPNLQGNIGFLNLERSVKDALKNFQQAAEFSVERINYPETAVVENQRKDKASAALRPETAKSYSDKADIHYNTENFSEALYCYQRALEIALKHYGEEDQRTADIYHSIGMTQHAQGDYSLAIKSKQRAMDIREKVFGDQHSSTSHSHYSLWVTEEAQRQVSSPDESKEPAINIDPSLPCKEHRRIAESYHSIGVTYQAKGDFNSALQYTQRALAEKIKLLGENHYSTADSYQSLGETQHAKDDFSSALQSKKRALDIKHKVIGEENSSTADSYHSLGLTQHALGDFSSALHSTQRALDIRLKLFGEEHPSTADSYHSLGLTLHAQGDFSSALRCTQHELDIRLKLFGEEHSSTADSYHLLGDTQHALEDLSSALQSKERALDIKLKVFGEEHSSIADCYHSLGLTQHALGDFSSALHSRQCALNITLNLFGKEHPNTATIYHSVGRIQHKPDAIEDTASPSSLDYTEADSQRKGDSATGQRVDDERVIWNAATKFESEHDECVRVLPYFNDNDVEIHLYVYCDTSSGIPSELKDAAQASFGHMGWKLVWADLYNDAFKLLKVTSVEYSSGEPKRLDASQVDQIDEIINENLHVFSSHRNVTAVKPSFKVKNSVETEVACITVYVLGKGQIPMGEFAFPRTIGSYPVDIVNGFFVRTKDPYPTRQAHKQDDVLRFGTSIGIKGKQSSGTLGAIVKDVNSGALYALSCDHVMNDAVESEIIHPGLDVYLNYLHHNLNEYKAYIQRIPRPPVELPPISDDILQDPAELQKKFSELKTTKAEYSASTGYSKGSLKNSTRCQETLEEAFAKEPRVIAKYLVGVRGNVGSEKNNGKKYFIDAAIAVLKDTEVNNLRAEEEVEIIGTPHYPSGECVSVTTDFEELEFFKSGSATGFTQRGVLVDSSYIKTSESVSNSIWTNVPCINCNQKEAAESQVRELCGPCEQCKGRNGWLERCLCIKQKGHNPFCDKGDSGAVVFGERRNAQSAYPGCGIIFGVLRCQYYIFALMSPLEIALEVLSRKVSDRRPNNKPCKLQLVSTYNPN